MPLSQRQCEKLEEKAPLNTVKKKYIYIYENYTHSKLESYIYIISISTDNVEMTEDNFSLTTEFILIGFTDHPQLKTPLFLVFFTICSHLQSMGLQRVWHDWATSLSFFLSLSIIQTLLCGPLYGWVDGIYLCRVNSNLYYHHSNNPLPLHPFHNFQNEI